SYLVLDQIRASLLRSFSKAVSASIIKSYTSALTSGYPPSLRPTAIVSIRINFVLSRFDPLTMVSVGTGPLARFGGLGGIFLSPLFLRSLYNPVLEFLPQLSDDFLLYPIYGLGSSGDYTSIF